jgi:hypothetical protein
MTHSLPIAETPEQLTPDWVTEALRLAGVIDEATKVIATEAALIGTGQMSDSARLALRYEGSTDAPASIVAKLPSADPTSRATALALGSYENEVRFYQQIAPRVKIRTPRPYYADIEPTTAAFVLLLEDLQPARTGDQLAGCDVQEANIAVDELVGLHAPLWGDPWLEELPWLHRDRTQQQMFLLMMLPQWWSGFNDRYSYRLGPEVHAAGGALFNHLDKYVNADTEPWTVVHGDYRLDNLLFTPDTVAVVDWQTCTHGPAMQDVAYFIGAGLLPDVRREVERDLVGRYHRGLLDAGVEKYDWDHCWYDYRRFTWAGLVMAVAASMLVERTDRGDEMFMAMAHRHSRHALDLGADRLLKDQ